MKKALIVFLICIAAFVRLYRFGDLTEFLGDQGRDGVIVQALFEQRKFPEIGSPLSTGQNTGPAHFYLVAPLFIASNFNPIIPALGLCVLEILAVACMLYLAISFFGFRIGFGISLLYALSPALVHQDRILWPPTPVPFFTLVVISSMYAIAVKKKYWALVPFFLANSILIQIHYANGIVSVVSAVFYALIIYRLYVQRKYTSYVVWTFISLLFSLITMLPFILFEIRNNFVDLTSALETFTSAKGLAFSKRAYLQNIVTVVSLLSGYIFPVTSKVFLVVATFGLMVFALLRRGVWSYFFVSWLIFGVAMLAYYRDTLQPQYAYGLIPLMFLILGFAFLYISKWVNTAVIVLVCVCMSLVMVFHLDIFRPARGDISRVERLTSKIADLSGGKPFSFTLISSPSYSDFHYRFYFNKNRITVSDIDSQAYNKLFLVCESGQCPTKEEIHMNQKVYVMCYDILCKLNYPIVNIWHWQFHGETRVGPWVIYEYIR